MRRLKRVWGQVKGSWRKSITAVGIIILIAILIFLAGDYAGLGIFNWAGVRDKTLWDWLQLLIIPVVLAGGAMWFSRAEREAERRRADDRSRIAALETFLDKITDVLLDPDWRRSEATLAQVKGALRVRTLTTLERLDVKRKGTVVRFLYMADLIERRNPDVELQQADLSGVNLSKIGLNGANLSKATLSKADLNTADLSAADLSAADLSAANLNWAKLSETDLSGANLRGTTLITAKLGGANLRRANLRGADLRGANLCEASLIGANLRGADLRGARLGKANLWDANLSRANLSETNLREANLIKITYDDYTLWPEDFTPPSDAIKKE